jgi:hypothetical protein
MFFSAPPPHPLQRILAVVGLTGHPLAGINLNETLQALCKAIRCRSGAGFSLSVTVFPTAVLGDVESGEVGRADAERVEGNRD